MHKVTNTNTNPLRVHETWIAPGEFCEVESLPVSSSFYRAVASGKLVVEELPEKPKKRASRRKKKVTDAG